MENGQKSDKIERLTICISLPFASFLPVLVNFLFVS